MSDIKLEDEVSDEQEFEFDSDTMEPTNEVEEEEVEVDLSFEANLALDLDSNVLNDIGDERLQVYTDLKNSREQWENKIRTSIKLLGVNTDGEGNVEVEGACTAVHPLLMENVVKFQAKAIQELWPAKGPVRTKIKGFVNPQREQAANRVRSYMNYQLTEVVSGFYSDLERNLFRVGFMGIGIRKAGWSPILGAPDPAIVYAENFYVDPTISHLKDADEYIEYMEMSSRKMENLVASKAFRDLGDEDSEESLTPNDITAAIVEAQGFELTSERKGFSICESHCYLDLGGEDHLLPDGGLAPYIVHFNAMSGKVYAIRRNWDEEDENRAKIIWYTVDNFIPAFGFYSFGYAHLIGDLTAASTAALRALVDSGQYANWTAGFKSKDAKYSDSDSPLGFGEFRDVNLSPEELQKAFLPLPVKEPSQTLMALLKYMVESGQKFADAADEVAQNGSNYGPVVTTLALLEASQRFYSSIHKRLHESQHEFFKLLGRLNYKNLPERVNFVVNDENQYVQRQDFNPEVVDIIPSSDPNAQTESQRVARAEIELKTAQQFPQLHDMKEALRRFYGALGTENVEKLLADPDKKAVSADPLSEIQLAMTGKPIKAVMGQDHAAHIKVKEAFLKSPQMQGTNDPTIVVGVNLLKSNMAEHKALMFIAQVTQMATENGMSPKDEKIQGIIAEAMIAKSAEQPGSPESTEAKMLQLQERELQIAEERIKSQDVRESAKIAQKDRELDIKELTLKVDADATNRKLSIESAAKVLENSAKLAENEQRRLSERAARFE